MDNATDIQTGVRIMNGVDHSYPRKMFVKSQPLLPISLSSASTQESAKHWFAGFYTFLGRAVVSSVLGKSRNRS